MEQGSQEKTKRINQISDEIKNSGNLKETYLEIKGNLFTV